MTKVDDAAEPLTTLIKNTIQRVSEWIDQATTQPYKRSEFIITFLFLFVFEYNNVIYVNYLITYLLHVNSNVTCFMFPTSCAG